MGRPRRLRRIFREPDVTYFKPRGIPLKELKEISLNVEEFEALRLKDFEGLDQNSCAEKMKVSQPTFYRIISSARKKVSDAIINAKAIKIEGGDYKL